MLYFEASTSINKVQIFNTVGQLISDYSFNTSKGQTDTSSLSQGMCLLKVLGENNTVLTTKRLLKTNQ